MLTNGIRIAPLGWKNNIAMRTELLGCYVKEYDSTTTLITTSKEIVTTTEKPVVG